MPIIEPEGPSVPVNAASTDNTTTAVHGTSYATQFHWVGAPPPALGNATGVEGQSGSGVGVVGTSDGNDAINGASNSSAHAGVAAHNTNGGFAFWGASDSAGGTGIYARGAKQAAQFDGAVRVADPNNEDALVSTSGSAGHAAVSAKNNGGGFAFWGESFSPGGTGIYAKGFLAAQFDGSVELNGPVHCNSTMTVDIDLILTNADCAEDFDIAASARIEPGTVMALDDGGSLRPSDQSYDKKVVGVISGAGELRPGMILDRHESVEKRAPLALMGKVCCKVDAQYGSIEVGDLLTTSSTPGHAMKATDPARAFGAVIGKALRPLAEGEGLIPVLVALQ